MPSLDEKGGMLRGENIAYDLETEIMAFKEGSTET